jgi:hypothetical protein
MHWWLSQVSMIATNSAGETPGGRSTRTAVVFQVVAIGASSCLSHCVPGVEAAVRGGIGPDVALRRFANGKGERRFRSRNSARSPMISEPDAYRATIADNS